MGWRDAPVIGDAAASQRTSAPRSRWMDAPVIEADETARAVGAEAALRGAQGIRETPWYGKSYFGLPSVTESLSALPALGGFAGGVAGGAGGTVFGIGVGGVPGAAAGAAFGGAAGEATRQHAVRALGGHGPETSGVAAKEIALEAGKQAAAELGGRALAGGAKALGRGMVENAVRPPISLQREFPGVIDTIVKERLPVGTRPFGAERGSTMAAKSLKEESEAVKRLLAKATAGGKNFETSKLAEPVLKLIDDVAEAEALSPGGVAQLGKLITNFLDKKKGPLSPFDVQKLKQMAQSIAKPIYKAIEKGHPVTADQSVLARFNASIAEGAKGAMETIPGVAAGEARKKSLIGATRALSQAEMRRLSLMGESIPAAAGIVSGLLSGQGQIDEGLKRAAITYGAIRLGLSPRALSLGGLILTNDQAQALLRQFPRLTEAVISVSREGGERGAKAP